jgi:NADP-dependent 3-hydroxy acid dehydrogenase YdfG
MRKLMGGKTVVITGGTSGIGEIAAETLAIRLVGNLGSRGRGCGGWQKLESRIMRYELRGFKWAAIKPFLPNKPRA